MDLPTNVRRAPAIGLTVAEVIERLRLLNPESIVVIEGRYGGLDSVRAMVPVDIMLNVNADPDFGPHERADGEDEGDARAIVLVNWPAREQG
jgi:hypothetical protein